MESVDLFSVRSMKGIVLCVATKLVLVFVTEAAQLSFSAEEVQQPVGVYSRRSATSRNTHLGFFQFSTANKTHSCSSTVVMNSFYGSQFLEHFELPPGLSLLPMMHGRFCEVATAIPVSQRCPPTRPRGSGRDFGMWCSITIESERDVAADCWLTPVTCCRNGSQAPYRVVRI